LRYDLASRRASWHTEHLKEEITVEVFTIGHSNHSADKFTGLLKQHGITMLVDVRSKPRSRFSQFQRDNLIELMRKANVTYLYGAGRCWWRGRA
jgi:hypothetical protein